MTMQPGRDILIADAGGTSTRWCLLGTDGYVKRDLHAAPVNVCVLDDRMILAALQAVDVLLESSSAVYFYGAGCATGNECDRVAAAFREIGFNGELHIHSDMFGAARALFGDEAGVACILGTGSNSCLYDGCRIVKNIPPLGFILGDEGGGASVGKKFLKRLIREELPEKIAASFYARENCSVSDIYEKVYREPRPNKFLASITEFVHDNVHEPAVRGVVDDCFDDFLGVITSGYGDLSGYPVGFVGSVAYYFDNILRTTASRHGLTVSLIERNPMPGLLRYHARRHGIKLNI